MYRNDFPKPLLPVTPRLRKCLRCNIEFISAGSGNRCCGECQKINNRQSRRSSRETNSGRRVGGSLPSGVS